MTRRKYPTVTIYRVHMHLFGASMGFQFYTTEKAAKEFARNWMNDNDEGHCSIESKQVELHDHGILSLLQHWAQHPKS